MKVTSKCRGKYRPGIIVALIKCGYSSHEANVITGYPMASIDTQFKRRVGISIKEYNGKGRLDIILPRDRLYELYVEKGYTQREIANECRVSQTGVSWLINKYNIKPNNGCDSFRYRGANAVNGDMHTREQAFADKVSSITDGRIEYVSGYEKRGSYVTLRCKECGAVFNRRNDADMFACPQCSSVKRELTKERKNLLHKLRVIANTKPYEHTCSICGQLYMSVYDSSMYCNKCKRELHNRDHVHRAKKRGAYYEHGITLHRLIKRDGNICQICGKPCDITDKRYGTCGPLYPSIDHVVAIANGGGHTWSNVQLAHMFCNSVKGDREQSETCERIQASTH